MYKKIIFVLFLCLLLVFPAAAAGGAGTAANPYIIQTPAELQSIQNNLAAYYVLGNDIDLQGYSFTPIGSISAPFSGQLDGNGYTISNLDISTTTQNIGFFSVLISGATIKNLKFTDCKIESTTSSCGILCGRFIHNTGLPITIHNIDMLHCSVFAYRDAGILCGVNIDAGSYTLITDCTIIYSHVKGNSYNIGGICGWNVAGGSISVTNCVVENSIIESNTASNVGGILGDCASSASTSVTNCAVENSIIKANSNFAGGLFGVFEDSGSNISATGCTITNCTILSPNYAGGVAGRIISNSAGYITSCTVTGCTILATSYAATICPAFGYGG